MNTISSMSSKTNNIASICNQNQNKTKQKTNPPPKKKKQKTKNKNKKHTPKTPCA
jgi:hypothetical protein